MIELKEIQATYEGFEQNKYLKIQNLQFNKGEITGIVGLNGSGKSTLLKTIVGLTKILSGQVLLDGKKVTSFGHKGRAKIVSYLPQVYPSPNMDVFTLVSHGRFPYLGFSKVLGKKDLDLIEKALRLTDLWELRFENLSEISGGQRQRAYLAMIIAQDTEYLLLDEAAASLDIKHQLEVVKVLEELAKEGKGIVLTSHDLPQSFSVCSKIYLMEKGEVVAQGKPEEIAASEKLSKVMGAGLKHSENEAALYEYQLVK